MAEKPSGRHHPGTAEIVRRAWQQHTAIPGFNIPYLPMMEPVVRALRDCDSFGLIMVARLELYKFEAKSLAAIRKEYERCGDPSFTRLHLDHVPVIDEDNLRVDYEGVLREAIGLWFESLMLDGSRLSLVENISATAAMAKLAHEAGIPIEAELGAIMGHESGPAPSYEELFTSGRGFTDPSEAQRFVRESGTDWLSVAIGNVHGAISKARKDERKVEARLSIERLKEIAKVAQVPLVLHGGTGIRKEFVLEGIRQGIAKVNIATAIRQPYEKARAESVAKGQDAVYRATVETLTKELELAGNRRAVLG